MAFSCIVLLLFGFMAVEQVQGVRRVCYYTNWSQYRWGAGKFAPEDIDTSLCTHVIYAFAKLDNNKLVNYEWNDISTPWSTGMYERVNNLKNSNPSLKTLLAVGGWTMGTFEMTKTLSSQENRILFANQAAEYLKEHNFDGLDLDFEYPGSRGSPPEDKKNFSFLLQTLRVIFDRQRPPLLLTAAVSAGIDTINNGYEIDQLNRHLDFVNLMSYDLHGAWDLTKTAHHAPLESPDISDQLTIKKAAGYWLSGGLEPMKGGIRPDKLVIGIPTYGRGYTMNGQTPRSASTSGKFTGEAGFLAYYEICQMRSQTGVEAGQVPGTGGAPFLRSGDQWIGYDNPVFIQTKVRELSRLATGGFMVWALDLDDFAGTCGEGRYPLLRAMNRAMGVTPVVNPPVQPPVIQPPEVPEPPVVEPPVVQPPVIEPPVVQPPVVEPPVVQPPVVEPPVVQPPVVSGDSCSSSFLENYCVGKNWLFLHVHPCTRKACTHFVQCYGASAHPMSCPPGTSFHPDQGYCDFTDRVPSCNSGDGSPYSQLNDPNSMWASIFGFSQSGLNIASTRQSAPPIPSNFRGNNNNFRRN